VLKCALLDAFKLPVRNKILMRMSLGFYRFTVHQTILTKLIVSGSRTIRLDPVRFSKMPYISSILCNIIQVSNGLDPANTPSDMVSQQDANVLRQFETITYQFIIRYGFRFMAKYCNQNKSGGGG